jgi:hypothetical protein
MLRIYTLCLAGIVGLGLGAAGCGSGGHGSGYFNVSWSFSGPGSVPTTCTAAGATEVDLDVRDVRTGETYSQTFYCTDYLDTSGPLPVDDYTVALSAYESPTATVPVSSTDFNGAVYSIYAGTITPLPAVTFLLQH